MIGVYQENIIITLLMGDIIIVLAARQANTAQAGIFNIVVHVMQAGILAPAHLHVLIVLQASILRRLKIPEWEVVFHVL